MAADARIVVFSRPGCHLCEQMIEELQPLVRGRGELLVHNIDLREDWRRDYGLRIPVLMIDDQLVCEGRLDPESVRAALA